MYLVFHMRSKYFVSPSLGWYVPKVRLAIWFYLSFCLSLFLKRSRSRNQRIISIRLPTIFQG